MALCFGTLYSENGLEKNGSNREKECGVSHQLELSHFFMTSRL